ncbi:transcriptional regulator, HxlR family [Actinacidiphila rubida]|uniref:Transcriptional regulator, HxlR family n=1 Tax=Actinacidiphila rubida TaxID=310780 RepID=A0A1H8GKC7_9ACTN|nr:transcriptional regulator, HxlR family [Actinacidiphila rubida]
MGVDDALTRVFELFGKRWTGLIVAVLTQRPAYFGEVRRALPRISERMLSDRLSELVDAGLVVREVDPGPPLRVSYGLTEAGRAIRPALYELGKWAEQYLPDSASCTEVEACVAESLVSADSMLTDPRDGAA